MENTYTRNPNPNPQHIGQMAVACGQDVRRKLTDAIEKDAANMIDRLQQLHERLLGFNNRILGLQPTKIGSGEQSNCIPNPTPTFAEVMGNSASAYDNLCEAIAVQMERLETIG